MSVLDLVRRSADPAPADALPAGEVWEVFRNHRRRRVIRYAASMNPGDAVTLGALADTLTAREHTSDYSSADRKCVYNSLYQIHLEKLDDIDAVDYDDERGVVRPGPQVGPLAEALDAASEVLAR